MSAPHRIGQSALFAILLVVMAAAVAPAQTPAAATRPDAPKAAPATRPARVPSPAHPASFPLVVKPGQTLTLAGDLLLSGDAVLDLQGTPENPCIVVGNSYQVKTRGEWTGRIHAAWCTFKQLGLPQEVIKIVNPGNWSGFKIEDPDVPAFAVTGGGKADIAFDHCAFDDSSFLTFTANGQTTLSFRNSTMLENGRYPVSEQPSTSRAAFTLTGNSSARKFFQGNRIFKGECQFHSPNILVGGDKDEDSNLVIGIRAKIAASGEGTIVRGNYVHVLLLGSDVPPHFEYWSQVWTFEPGAGTLAEHNVIRDGEWIVRLVEGEFRYNLICDINDHDLCQTGSIGKIHHNLFIGTQPKHFQGSMGACIDIAWKPKTPDGGVEIYNNTIDGCGWLAVPGVDVGRENFVKTLRNNLFCNFALGEKFYKNPGAIIAPGWNEAYPTTQPARLGYADYNAFYNPQSKSKINYLLTVAGKTLRKDAGFGAHDAGKGGTVDEQTDPKLTGPLSKDFPFNDADIKSGKVTVSQMLAHFRKAYTPSEGSPLIDAGDPADGDGTDIGAVGAGKPDKQDQFGKWGSAPPAR